MRKDAIYQLLAARFCHDLASPINAAGLLLEAGLEEEMQSLAQQNHANLVSILRFYRLMFTYRPNEDILGKTLEAIQESCCHRGVETHIWIARQDSLENWIPSNLLKALVVIFYSLLPHLSEHDCIRLIDSEENEHELIPESSLTIERELQENNSVWFPRNSYKTEHNVRLKKHFELIVETQNPLSDFFSAWCTSLEQAEPSSQDAFPLFLDSVLAGPDALGTVQQRKKGLQTSFLFYEVQRA